MHNAFLNIDKHKMSKSLGNFFTVREISEKYDLQVLRFFMLTSHYRSPLEFSNNPEHPEESSLEQAKTSLARIRTAYAKVAELLSSAEGSMTEEESAKKADVQKFVTAFETAMNDDFNTADALAAVFDLVRYVNKEASKESSKAFLTLLQETFDTLCGVLGIIPEEKAQELDEKIEKLIEERQAARKAKDFAKADAIRDELLSQGIVLEDTREGVKWHRA